MRLVRNTRAISRLLLILLMLASAIIGAIFSYMWVVGYYENLKIRIPEESDVTIANATFPPEDTHFFNVTIFNPSYSPSDAEIARIATSTEDGLIHNITASFPPLPYTLPKATRDFSGSETFTCTWNWANYTGETVGIIAFLAEGSGSTAEKETPFVDLSITDVGFDSSTSVMHFEVTIQNVVSSTTSNITVELTDISIIAEDGIRPNITQIDPSLPLSLGPGDSHAFICTWDWTNYQNTNVTVAVHTLQGYMNYVTETTPPPVLLEITDTLFDVANATHFAIAVENDNLSPTYLNVTEIGVFVENQKIRHWTVENGTDVDPSIPYMLDKGSAETFVCPWNWSDYRDVEVSIVMDTTQGFRANYTQLTPPPVVLNITDVIFEPTDTNQFNFTVQNSEFSLTDTEITGVFVTSEDNIVANFTADLGLPMQLNRTHSVTFTVPWEWGAYIGESVTIVVENEQGYFFYSDPIILMT